MVNDPESARAYHERTKHSFESVRGSAHRLLWDIQPLPFKIYPKLEPIPLPRDMGRIAIPALDALGTPDDCEAGAFDVSTLARVLQYSAGITKERAYGDRRMYFRAAPCTGALYHIDLYVVCGDVPGDGAADLPAGVYHFGPHDFALRCLRAGDHRGALIEASAGEASVRLAPVTLIVASTFWRNAWKYQSRAYRHCWWDSGTMLAHTLAVAAAERLQAQLVMGFVDRDVARLVGLDERREAALALVSLGFDASAEPPPVGALAALELETAPLSSREVDYPAIREMHAASSLPDAESVRRWREGEGADVGRSVTAAATGALAAAAGRTPVPDQAAPGAVTLPALTARPDIELDRTIAKRGSTRVFAHEPISAAVLGSMLRPALAPVPFDVRPAVGPQFDDVYLILNAVDGMEPGTYAVAPAPERGGLLRAQRLRSGLFRREAGHLGLGQDIPADAAADIYFLADLEPLLARYGARGYRLAQLEAAIHGGRMYLAAYALGLGASGLTFFDDDVTAFFSPHAEGKSVLFLVAVGVPRKRGMTSV